MKKKLGFQKIVSVPDEVDSFEFAIIRKDNISIILQEKASLIEEYPTLKANEIIPTFTLFITVKDVSKLYQSIKENVELAKELHKTFYGKAEFAIFDNNGNILTISC